MASPSPPTADSGRLRWRAPPPPVSTAPPPPDLHRHRFDSPGPVASSALRADSLLRLGFRPAATALRRSSCATRPATLGCWRRCPPSPQAGVARRGWCRGTLVPPVPPPPPRITANPPSWATPLSLTLWLYVLLDASHWLWLVILHWLGCCDDSFSYATVGYGTVMCNIILWLCWCDWCSYDSVVLCAVVLPFECLDHSNMSELLGCSY
jgi:hypothetical protein